MSPPLVVKLDPRAASAFNLPRASPAGRYWSLDDGQVVRVEADGTVEQLVRGGSPWWRSVASDPCAGMRGAM